MNETVRDYLNTFAISGWTPQVRKAPPPHGHVTSNVPPGLRFQIALGAWMGATNGTPPNPRDITHDELMYVTASRAVAQGVKVFCPNVAEAEMLAATDADLTPADYRQPYPTMLYVMPEPLRAGEVEGFGPGSWGLVAVDVLAPGRVLVTGVSRHPVGDRTYFSYPHHARPMRDSVTEHLDPKTAEVARIAVNAGLYLSVKGTTERPADPGRVDALKRRKKGKPAEWKDIQRLIRSEPTLVEPDRRIVFRQPSRSDNRRGIPTGVSQRPHQRRGHFKRQACGPQWKDHKLIFVEPYAVGDPRDFGGTHTEYVSPA